MSLSLWFRSPRYLLTLFLAIMLALAATLSWLSWRSLKQDRALESQRIQERLDNAADLIAASLLRKFSESKDQFTSLLALSDSDLAMRASELAGQGAGTALIVVFRPQAVDAYPRAALLYYPFLPTAKDTGTEHERTALPSTSTVHEPHWPRPQPKSGPCNPRSSRSAYSSGIFVSSATIDAGLPFTLSASFIEAPSPGPHHFVPAQATWE